MNSGLPESISIILVHYEDFTERQKLPARKKHGVLCGGAVEGLVPLGEAPHTRICCYKILLKPCFGGV